MINGPAANDRQKSSYPLSRGIKRGLIAGFISIIVTDIIMAGMFILLAKPAGIFFSFVADAAVAFSSILGLTLKSSPILGAILHYILGLTFGLAYGYATYRFEYIRNCSVGRSILFCILYVEIVSAVLLIPALLILHLTSSETLELFGIALVLHGIWGISFGLMIRFRSR